MVSQDLLVIALALGWTLHEYKLFHHGQQIIKSATQARLVFNTSPPVPPLRFSIWGLNEPDEPNEEGLLRLLTQSLHPNLGSQPPVPPRSEVVRELGARLGWTMGDGEAVSPDGRRVDLDGSDLVGVLRQFARCHLCNMEDQ